MTRTSVVLIALWCAIGCSFKGNGSADDTSADDTSAGDDTTGDDAVDLDAAPADVDGDGVFDPDDNCVAVENADQFNEDGDDRGDACDRCPHLGGADVAGADGDTDADGVGDQCDPRVGMDRIALFRGFNSAADAAGFMVNTGTDDWTISDGQMHQASSSTTSARELLWRDESLGDVAVTSAIHVDAVSGTIGTRSASVIGAYTDATEPSADDFYSCGLRGSNPDDPATLAAWHYNDPPYTDNWDEVSYTGTMSPGLAGVVRLVATTEDPASVLRCRAGATARDLDVSGYTPAGYPGLRTLGVSASFDYIFVVAIGTE